jgi:hypothetical protein
MNRGYQHAIDSGVYLTGVDSSHIGALLPVARDEIGDPSVYEIDGKPGRLQFQSVRWLMLSGM